MNRYLIITAVYNAGDFFFDRYARSIAMQTYPNMEVMIVDDASTDGTKIRVQETAVENGWGYRLNDTHQGALYNQVWAIRELDPQPDDILVFVDGDDQLSHPHVLQSLERFYQNSTLLTYGQYASIPYSHTCQLAARYPEQIIHDRSFRWCAATGRGIYWNHLRTFKAALFNELTDADFIDQSGQFYQAAADAALMYPCLELAAPYITFIDETLYYYTSDNMISDWRTQPRGCDRAHQHILARPPKR